MTTPTSDAAPAGTTRLVYGIFDSEDTIVLLPEQVAIEMVEEIEAVTEARTYGDLRRVTLRHLPSPEPDPDSTEEPAPPDDAPWDVEKIIDHDSTLWPPMVANYLQENEVVPRSVLDRIGAPVETMWDGPSFVIPPANEQELLDVLAQAGFESRRDDELLTRCQTFGENLEVVLASLRRERGNAGGA